MFDINLESAVAAKDPDLTKQLKSNRPAVAPPTGVPNRHTTFVPSENTTFSMGEKCKDRITTSASPAAPTTTFISRWWPRTRRSCRSGAAPPTR